MSAPTTHDPLVVTTRNGVTWVRRAVVDGRGLYAVTDSCKCPEYLMATLAELAEHGIAGSADALPMPVAPEPSELERLRARVAELEALVAAARTEAIADVGGWLNEVGEEGASYLVRTVDIPAAREMREPEPEFHAFLRKGRVPHDLPETGGGS